MDFGTIMTLGSVGAGFLGLLGTAWWRITVMIGAARTETAAAAAEAAKLASTARDELADHRQHVAEHYVSKQGLREVRDEIMGAIGTVGQTVRGMSDRIDRLVDRPAG